MLSALIMIFWCLQAEMVLKQHQLLTTPMLAEVLS